MKPISKVLVYGGGAVGSILGWRVAQNSHIAVTMVCRSNYDVVRSYGYKLRTKTWGSGQFLPHQVLRSRSIVDLVQTRRYDYLICANKITDHYASTLHDLRNLVGPRTTLITAQNGMDVETPLQREFPNNPILSAVCNVGCSQVSPGYIEQLTKLKRPAFSIGAYGPPDGPAAARRDAFSALDSQFQTVTCVYQDRWQKLVFNSAWNSVTALTGLNTHEVLALPSAVEFVYNIANETQYVATANGVALEPDLPEKVIELARTSPPITPSTLQDVRKDRPLELAPIFGYLITQAAKSSLDVPYLTSVYNLLQQRNRTSIAREAAPSSSRQPPSWIGNGFDMDRLSRDSVGMVASTT